MELVMSQPDQQASNRGNPLRNVSQGGGVQSSLSGGDERSEPESQFSFPSSVSATCQRMVWPPAGAREARPAGGLPCLLSNNCTKEDKTNVLTGAHKRTAFMVAYEIEWLVREFGLERIGFFTLTFKDHVTDLREAQRRFRSLRAHVIVKRYQRAIGVWERHKSGRIHFHLVVVLDNDIRSDADFAAFKRGNYRSANSALRAEWAFWRQTCPKYGFGRHELMPVKSNAEGISRYVGKYISKHITQRLPEDKGARVVRFIGFKPGTRRTCGRFSWNNTNGWLWRQKVKTFAGRFGLTDLDQMKRHFGARWAYHLQDQILGEQLEGMVFPSRPAGERYLNQAVPMLVAQYRAKEFLEQMQATQTHLLKVRKYDPDTPVWAVPRWCGEKMEKIPVSQEAIRQAEENKTQMRLYALRIPPLHEPRRIEWLG
jgi:hypothetical protein